MNDKRLTKSYKSQKRATKLTLLSCAWGCSSKLQVIQSFSTLFQWPSKVLSTSIYKHTLFLYFLDFSFFYWKKKTNKQTQKQQDLLKNKHLNTQEMQEQRWNHLNEFFSFQTRDMEGDEPFLFWDLWWGEYEGGLNPLKFVKNITAFKSTPKGVKEFWNWFWLLKDNTLLLCWVANYL